MGQNCSTMLDGIPQLPIIIELLIVVTGFNARQHIITSAG